ncbi:hypothetical protein OWV82_008077 [Melia azedarach]|uniref:Uncharacterized protein n=1 Tax=Melia azedarach TaxID=155640 RepID=A0ACC1YAT8_MELAZ|nr:hypothetical protein OWV82_008077 [Melia azedarach]
MAKTQKPHHLTAIVMLLFSLLLTISQYSSARQLHDYLPQNLAVPEPTATSFRIALPSDKVEASPKKVKQQPRHDMEAKQNSEMRSFVSASAPKLAGKYRPLVLNILPKGTVPPSGPSKGINDVKN